jgi:hypothetical protein
MSDQSNVQPAPAPVSGENSPKLEIVPPPRKRRTSSDLNLRQVRQVEGVKQNCLTAQKPAYAAKLEEKGIAPAFVATLLADIGAAIGTGSSAIQHTNSAAACARCVTTAEAP